MRSEEQNRSKWAQTSPVRRPKESRIPYPPKKQFRKTVVPNSAILCAVLWSETEGGNPPSPPPKKKMQDGVVGMSFGPF